MLVACKSNLKNRLLCHLIDITPSWHWWKVGTINQMQILKCHFLIVLHVRYTNIYLQCLFVDNYILEIFNKENGLLQFIKEVLCNKIYEKSKLKSFELLHTLVNNCHGKIEKHFSYILFTCVPIIFSSYASSDEKSKVITLVVLILDKGRNSIDDETVVKIYDQLFRCMCSSFVKTPTGTCISFI